MRIELNGIRSFSDNSGNINVDGLSLITGKNSSGKSTFIKALKMLSDAIPAEDDACINHMLGSSIKFDNFEKDIKQASLGVKNDVKFILSQDKYETLTISYALSEGKQIAKFHALYQTVYDDILNYVETIESTGDPRDPTPIVNYTCNFEANLKYYKKQVQDSLKFIEIEPTVEPSSLSGIIKDIVEKHISQSSKETIYGRINEFLTSSLKALTSSNSETSVQVRKLISKIGELNNNHDPYANYQWENILNLDQDSFISHLKDILQDHDETIWLYFIQNGEPNLLTENGENLFILLKIFIKMFDDKAKEFLKNVPKYHFISTEDIAITERGYFSIKSREDASKVNWLSSAFNYFYPLQEKRKVGELEMKIKPKPDISIDDLNKMLEELKIDAEIIFKREPGPSELGSIHLNRNGIHTNIFDEGRGYYNIILLMLYIQVKLLEYRNWPYYEKQYEGSGKGAAISIIFNEPEIGLHPDLQGNLIGLICNFLSPVRNWDGKVNIIIETHSTIFIDRLRLEMVRGQVVTPANARVYYFEKDMNQTSIKEINIDKNGMLSKRFGSGFLDESHKLIEDRLNFKSN